MKNQHSVHTSFVFHRCLSIGKWSARGRLSRFSGNLIGSPSRNKKKEQIENENYYNIKPRKMRKKN